MRFLSQSFQISPSWPAFRLSSLLFALLLSLAAGTASADVEITELDWNTLRQHDRQREWIIELAREELAERIRQDQSDLKTLQRLIDRKLIPQSDAMRLQALGVILGDVFNAQLGLEWRSYKDDKGKSRASCLPGTEHCLFPITMLSRRIEVGLRPDVSKIYLEAAELMDPYLPKSPYDAKSKRKP